MHIVENIYPSFECFVMVVFWNNLRKNASNFSKENVWFKGELDSFSQNNTNRSKEGIGYGV
jgi:hypothetical protein